MSLGLVEAKQDLHTALRFATKEGDGSQIAKIEELLRNLNE